MRRYRKRIAVIYACLSATLFGGCGVLQEGAESNIGFYAATEGMESTPVVDYSVPRLLPNVLVDINGYTIDCEKQAAVKGHELPETFRLIDAQTGEEVFSGYLDKITYNEELELYTGFARFGDYTVEGTYYLECDKIGRSYRFDIKGSLYVELFREVCEPLIDACEDHTLTVSEALALLTTYEWYSDIFSDENRDQIPDVLKSLQSWVSYMEESEIDAKDRALYAAFLAKFGYNYQKFDQQYATDCLRRASTVFGQVQTTLGRDADAFWALTELYRATGMYTYRNQISDYMSFFKNNGGYLDETEYLYGVMTYMSTRQKVEVELCELFMRDLMNRGEEISKRYEDMIHPVAARNNGADDLLKNAVELSCANYVLNIYQYTNTIEEFLHYLMGQNVESMNFYPEEGERTKYLILFAQLAQIHMEDGAE